MRTVYVGTYTEGERPGKGITVFKVTDNGDWDLIQEIAVEKNPSYQCLSPDGEFLYSVHGDSDMVSSYNINEEGTLEHLNTLSTGGDNPVHISHNPVFPVIATASFNNGMVSVLKTGEDGSLKNVVTEFRIPGKAESSNSNAHQAYWDRTGTYLFVPTQNRCQGFGQIKVFRYDHEEGTLTDHFTWLSRAFDEPRHVVMNRANDRLYLANEKGNTVVYFSFNWKDGTLDALEYLPTLRSTYTGRNKTAAIDMNSDESYLTVSNRYHDSIALFRIKEDGHLEFCDAFPVEGNIPRYAGFNDDSSFFYSANLTSDEIVEMEPDWNKGTLTPVRHIKVNKPYCMTFRNE